MSKEAGFQMSVGPEGEELLREAHRRHTDGLFVSEAIFRREDTYLLSGEIRKELLDRLVLIEQERELLETFINRPAPFGRRVASHLIRLVGKGRTEIEKTFGLALARFGPEKIAEISDENKRTRVARVMDSEGDDTILWWTFSPHLFDQLTNFCGQSEEQAIGVLLSWGTTGRHFCDEESVLAHYRVFLWGLRSLRVLSVRPYYLHGNESDITHQATAFVSRILAPLLVEEFGSFASIGSA